MGDEGFPLAYFVFRIPIVELLQSVPGGGGRGYGNSQLLKAEFGLNVLKMIHCSSSGQIEKASVITWSGSLYPPPLRASMEESMIKGMTDSLKSSTAAQRPPKGAIPPIPFFTFMQNLACGSFFSCSFYNSADFP